MACQPILGISLPGNCSKEVGHLCACSPFCRKESALYLCFHDLQQDDGMLLLVGQEGKGQETARAHTYVTSTSCRAACFLQQQLKGLPRTQPGQVPWGSSDLIIAVDTSPHKTNRKCMPASPVESYTFPSKETTANSMGRKSALLLRRKSAAFLSLGWDTELVSGGPSSGCFESETFPCC